TPPEPAAMGRDDGRGPERRARERVEKGLGRRDLDMALEGLLALPPAARGAVVGPVAALFSATVASLRQAGAWGRLHMLAARAEAEPALLGVSRGAGDAACDELRWD